MSLPTIPVFGPGGAMTGSVPTGRILLRSAKALAAAAPAPPAIDAPNPLVPGLWTDPPIMLETSDAVWLARRLCRGLVGGAAPSPVYLCCEFIRAILSCSTLCCLSSSALSSSFFCRLFLNRDRTAYIAPPAATACLKVWCLPCLEGELDM